MNFQLSKRKKDNGLFDQNSIKVIIIGCLTIISALIVMSVTIITIMEDAVVKKLKDNDLEILAESISMAIEGKIDKSVESSLIMANDPLVINWVEKGETDQIETNQVEMKMKDLVENLGYDTAFLVGNKTLHYWSYHDSTFELLDTMSKVDPYDEWYFKFIDRKTEYEINIDFNKELNDTFVWINAVGGDVEHPDVAAGLGLNLSQVIDKLIKDDSGIKNDIWLVDGNGTIFLAKNQKNIEKNVKDFLPASLIKKMYQKNSPEDQFEVAEYKNTKKQKYDIAFKRIKNTEWRLIVQIPRAESLKFLEKVKTNTIISCSIIILLMVITFYFVSNRIANPYKRALQLNEELENMVALRTKELQEKNNQIQDSLDYAEKIQQMILPNDSDLEKYLKEYFVIFEPRDTVGGDFYWIRNFEDGTLLIIGDCTGHGVPGALMATAVNAMLDHITEGICHNNPAIILKELDRLLQKSFRTDENEELVSDGLDAAVLFLSESNKILYAGANMSLFISNGKMITELKGNKCMIDCSVSKMDMSFHNREIDYVSDTMIYVATDGFKDQPGGERKLPFGKKRFTDLLKAVAHLEMEQQRVQIRIALQTYEAEEARRDDVTMIGFKL